MLYHCDHIKFENILNYIDAEYESIIDYITGLKIASSLMERDSEYKILELSQSYLVSMHKKDIYDRMYYDVRFILSKFNRKMDIEGYARLSKRLYEVNIEYNLFKLGLNLNQDLTVIDLYENYFYISLNSIPTVDQIIKVREMMEW